MASRHVVVIGAGIVGVSCALHARSRGWQVTLLDPRGLAGGASAGNAGVIAVSECIPVGTPGTLAAVPQMLLSKDGPLHIRPSYFPQLLPWLLRMVLASTPANVERLSISLAEIMKYALSAHFELADAAGIRSQITRTGWLKAFESEKSFSHVTADVELMRRRDVICDELDSDDIARLDPSLAGKFARGVFHPDCHQVGNPRTYVQALGAHLLNMGIEWKAIQATGFDFDGQRVVSVRTECGDIEASHVVLAAGAWSKRLAAQLGCSVPLDTERGYHMMIDVSGCNRTLRHPVYWAEKSIVLTPMDGAIRVTSSVEFAGVDAPPNYELVRRALPDVLNLFPGAVLIPNSEWLGLRPSIPDSLPVIGRAVKVPNAVLAFGHGHLGITLGPITGKLVGELLDEEDSSIDLTPFSPHRFGRFNCRTGSSANRVRNERASFSNE